MARLKMFDLNNPRTATQRGWRVTLSNEGGALLRLLGFDGSAYGDTSVNRETNGPAFCRALSRVLGAYYCQADVQLVDTEADGRVVWVAARDATRHDKAVWLMQALGFEQAPGAFQWYRLQPGFRGAGNRI